MEPRHAPPLTAWLAAGSGSASGAAETGPSLVRQGAGFGRTSLLNFGAPPNHTRGAAGQTERIGRVRRVLLVDDDRQYRQALTRELLRHGYRVEEAEDGLEAIDRAILDPPDVAIVDLIMPRIGGREIVALFRQNPFLAAIPVI